MFRRLYAVFLFACWLVIGSGAAQAQDAVPAVPASQVTVDPPKSSALPNGRTIEPVGKWTWVSSFPYTLSIRPDGKQLVTPSVGTPFALSVVDDPGSEGAKFHRLPEMKDAAGNNVIPSDDPHLRVSRSSDPNVQSHMNAAYSLDGTRLYDPTGDTGAVDVYDTTTWQRVERIELNTPWKGKTYKETFAAVAVLSKDGKSLFVLDAGNWRVAAVDLETKKVVGSAPTGVNPFAMALSPDGTKLYVTNTGLFEYQLVKGVTMANRLNTGLKFPPTAYPSKEAREGTVAEGHEIQALGNENDPKGSSLWTYDASSAAGLKQIAALRLGSRIQEGRNKVVGGASPSGIAVSDGHVYVSLAHQDSVAVLSADGKRLEHEIPLSPFAGSAYYKDKLGRPLRGVMPFGLALADGRLYVAESGTNSVGVIDTASNRVLTHIPVGWFPAAVAVSPDKKTLYVVNNKGKGSNVSLLPGAYGSWSRDRIYGSISSIPLPVEAKDYAGLTETVVKTNEAAVMQSLPLPRVKHMFFIIRENHTFDEIFGDVKGLNGDPSLARIGIHGWVPENPLLKDVAITPNAHALAERFAISDNFYVDSEVSADGHRWVVGIAPTPWMHLAWTTHYGGRRHEFPGSEAPGRRAMQGGADSPDADDEPQFGSLWEHVAGAGLPIMNYGEGLEIEGDDEAEGLDEMGTRFFLNVPLLEPIFDSTDHKYPTFNMGIPDQYRVAEFERDFTAKVKSAAGYKAALTVIRLPNDHTGPKRPDDGYAYGASYIADNDLALGKIVEIISHSPVWKDSAIFVVEDDPGGGVDHVDSHRSPLLIISPYTRRGYVSHRHSDYGSVMKTMYEFLGLGALNLEDALTADVSDAFSATPDVTPFTHVASDKRVFDEAKAKIAHPKTEAEREELLKMDDPDEVEREAKKYLSSARRRPSGN